jgi:hypothetical protein
MGKRVPGNYKQEQNTHQNQIIGPLSLSFWRQATAGMVLVPTYQCACTGTWYICAPVLVLVPAICTRTGSRQGTSRRQAAATTGSAGRKTPPFYFMIFPSARQGVMSESVSSSAHTSATSQSSTGILRTPRQIIYLAN